MTELKTGIHLPSSLALNDVQISQAESTIRDMAATTCSHAATKKAHPSYGVTKTSIRADLAHMEGAIGLYMVLTGQASHASVFRLCKFQFPETDERVKTARRLVEEM